MPNLRDQFQHFYMPDDDAIATAMQTGLVTPDANVLLGLYRVQTTARDELFGAFEMLGKRLWVPYQVGLEFHRNRLSVMKEQEEYFGKTQKEFDAAIEGLCERVREFAGARFALATESVVQIENTIRLAQRLISGYVTDAEKANDVHLKDHDSDKVLARLEALLGDRVGEPMERKELEDARKEARRRVEAKEPPGYKDRDKPDPTGDYLIFKQLMNEAAKQKLPAVFVTDDRKEDWYRREHGLTLGARYELREQMMAGAGVPFIIMTTETFLLNAEKHLNAEVSDETIAQAKELPGQFEPAAGGFLSGNTSMAEVMSATGDLQQLSEFMERLGTRRLSRRERMAFEQALLSRLGEAEKAHRPREAEAFRRAYEAVSASEADDTLLDLVRVARHAIKRQNMAATGQYELFDDFEDFEGDDGR